MRQHSPARKSLWMAHLTACSAFAVAWLLEWTVVADQPDLSVGLAGFAVACVGLLPLLGHIKQRAYRPRWLWRAYFYVAMLSTALAFVGIVSRGMGITIGEVVWAVVSLFLVYFYLVALNEYLNGSPHLWRT
jgi:hypothetical protein